MENIVEKVEDVLKTNQNKLDNNDNFKKLKDYVDDAKNKGLTRPQTYNLPPIDTVGRRFFDNNTKNKIF